MHTYTMNKILLALSECSLTYSSVKYNELNFHNLSLWINE